MVLIRGVSCPRFATVDISREAFAADHLSLRSANLTQRLTREELGDRDSYYTSIDDHVNHCSVLWKKQFWTLFEERKTFDAIIANIYHTEHCADFLKDIYRSNRTESTFVKVGYSGCWVKKGEGKQ